ncbi:PIN domain-like protein [Lyophyllum atratum]|nr:PIN domain-like protein [Lyophyllum atratum]
MAGTKQVLTLQRYSTIHILEIQAVAPAEREHSLLNLTTREGYLRNPERRYLVLGVDMNLWMDSCQAAFEAAGIHTHAGENPELRTLYSKLCRYLKLPVVLVFVPDGEGRPAIKRGRAVQPQPLWMSDYVEELVRAFGFYIHQAPGEAEAELAKLNSLGMIDAILTDDSDTLVFGGECIIRSAPGSTNFDRILLYDANSIEHSEGVKLTRGGLLLFALMAGGDYDPGISGCGPKTAHAMAKCGFGDALINAAMTMSGAVLQDFLSSWRKDLQHELQSNSLRWMDGRCISIARKITDEFPDLTVLDNYLNPLTSWSPQCTRKVPDTNEWRSREPLIPLITAFCVRHFGWGRDGGLLKRFRSKLWEGVAFRILCSPLVRCNNATHCLATPAANFVIKSHSASKTVMSRLTPSRRLEITMKNFQALMGPPWSAANLEDDIIPVHIPTVILQAASPDILKTLSAKQKKSAPKAKVIQTMHPEVIEVLDSDDEGGAAIVIDLT